MNCKENTEKNRFLKRIRLTLLLYPSILSPLEGNKTQATSTKLPHVATQVLRVTSQDFK